jgi:hypothetical protein
MLKNATIQVALKRRAHMLLEVHVFQNEVLKEAFITLTEGQPDLNSLLYPMLL